MIKNNLVPDAAVFLRLFSSDAARSASVKSTSGELELLFEAAVDAWACCPRLIASE